MVQFTLRTVWKIYFFLSAQDFVHNTTTLYFYWQPCFGLYHTVHRPWSIKYKHTTIGLEFPTPTFSRQVWSPIFQSLRTSHTTYNLLFNPITSASIWIITVNLNREVVRSSETSVQINDHLCKSRNWLFNFFFNSFRLVLYLFTFIHIHIKILTLYTSIYKLKQFTVFRTPKCTEGVLSALIDWLLSYKFLISLVFFIPDYYIH